MTETPAPNAAEPIEAPDTADDQPDSPPNQGLTEDQLKAKRYAAEAASWRKKLRGAEARTKELEAELASLKGDRSDLDGTPTPNSPAFLQSELASLRRQVSEARKAADEANGKWKAAEDKSRRVAHENLIGKLTSGLKDPVAATELLLGKTKLSDDEKTLVFSTKDKDTGEMIEVELTSDSLKSSGLLGPIFFPPEGPSGNGTGAPNPAKPKLGVDLSKINDAAYFRENKEAILKARRRA